MSWRTACVELRVSLVMLEAGNPWGYWPGPILFLVTGPFPPNISLPEPVLLLHQPVCFLFRLKDTLQQQPSGNFEKRAYYSQYWRVHSMPKGGTEWGREIWVLPLLGGRVQGLKGSIFIGIFKTYQQELEWGKEKGHSTSQLARSPRAFQKANFIDWGSACLLIYSCLAITVSHSWDMFTWDECLWMDALAIKYLLCGTYSRRVQASRETLLSQSKITRTDFKECFELAKMLSQAFFYGSENKSRNQ